MFLLRDGLLTLIYNASYIALLRFWSLLLHVRLRQGMSWYALGNIEHLLPALHLDESEI